MQVFSVNVFYDFPRQLLCAQCPNKQKFQKSPFFSDGYGQILPQVKLHEMLKTFFARH
jgi:hypothetical protein